MKKTTMVFLLMGAGIISLCTSPAYAKKSKVFYVNSYHKTFPWSDGIEHGLLEALNCMDKRHSASPDRVSVKIDCSQRQVELVVWRIDTKRNTDTDWRKAQALKIMDYFKTLRLRTGHCGGVMPQNRRQMRKAALGGCTLGLFHIL